MRNVWLTMRCETTTLAPMARGGRLHSLIASVWSGGRAVYELGVAAVFVVCVPVLVLMGLGLVVRDLSTAVGAPLPYVHDDPNRVEWAGIAELVGYGFAGALTLYALYAFSQRGLSATARGHLDRAIGAAVLLLLAASGAWVAIDTWDPAAAIFALSCGYGVIRVMRGLSLDDEDEREDGGSERPAS